MSNNITYSRTQILAAISGAKKLSLLLSLGLAQACYESHTLDDTNLNDSAGALGSAGMQGSAGALGAAGSTGGTSGNEFASGTSTRGSMASLSTVLDISYDDPKYRCTTELALKGSPTGLVVEQLNCDPVVSAGQKIHCGIYLNNRSESVSPAKTATLSGSQEGSPSFAFGSCEIPEIAAHSSQFSSCTVVPPSLELNTGLYRWRLIASELYQSQHAQKGTVTYSETAQGTETVQIQHGACTARVQDDNAQQIKVTCDFNLANHRSDKASGYIQLTVQELIETSSNRIIAPCFFEGIEADSNRAIHCESFYQGDGNKLSAIRAELVINGNNPYTSNVRFSQALIASNLQGGKRRILSIDCSQERFNQSEPFDCMTQAINTSAAALPEESIEFKIPFAKVVSTPSLTSQPLSSIELDNTITFTCQAPAQSSGEVSLLKCRGNADALIPDFSLPWGFTDYSTPSRVGYCIDPDELGIAIVSAECGVDGCLIVLKNNTSSASSPDLNLEEYSNNHYSPLQSHVSHPLPTIGAGETYTLKVIVQDRTGTRFQLGRWDASFAPQYYDIIID